VPSLRGAPLRPPRKSADDEPEQAGEVDGERKRGPNPFHDYRQLLQPSPWLSQRLGVDQAARRRRIAANPTNPAPSSEMVIGSGTEGGGGAIPKKPKIRSL
jgi:hypothetical protein